MFGGSKKVDTNKEKIKTLLSRGVENVIPGELAEKKLSSGEGLRVYLGIDPTGAQLHVGHTVPLRKLQDFADLGHEVIFLVGSFTAMIGDPTGRDAARAALTREDVEANFKDYKKQASKVLDFSKIKVRYNHEWLDKVNFEKLVSLASNFTVQQMIQRDMFQRRLKEEKPISLHEFLYPLMVGYDSVMLDVDCELGGSDQEFNMLAGRTLQTALGKRDKFVITTKLLEGTDGRKMSKSYDNCIYITDTPKDMFGKAMSIRDELVSTYFDIATDVSEEKQKEILSGHPRDAKLALAHELVRMYHGTTPADEEKENFIKTFSQKEVPQNVDECSVKGSVAASLVASGVVSSKSELRRLLEGGAVKVAGNEEKLNAETLEAVALGTTLRIGKNRFVKIVK